MMSWLFFEDTLVRAAIPDWKAGIEAKDLPNGDLFVKVETEDGRIKTAVIPYSVRAENAYRIVTDFGGCASKKQVLAEIGLPIPDAGTR